jgi:hypothetical protein
VSKYESPLSSSKRKASQDIAKSIQPDKKTSLAREVLSSRPIKSAKLDSVSRSALGKTMLSKKTFASNKVPSSCNMLRKKVQITAAQRAKALRLKAAQAIAVAAEAAEAKVQKEKHEQKIKAAQAEKNKRKQEEELARARARAKAVAQAKQRAKTEKLANSASALAKKSNNTKENSVPKVHKNHNQHHRSHASSSKKWAEKEELEKSLLRQTTYQQFYDMERIFGGIPQCDIGHIFPKSSNKHLMRSRRSSGNWLHDKVTEDERRNYDDAFEAWASNPVDGLPC